MVGERLQHLQWRCAQTVSSRMGRSTVKDKSEKYSIIFVFLVSIILSSCSSGGDSGISVVSNTNFEAVESFTFVVPVLNHTQFTLIGVNGEIEINGNTGANSVTITGIKRVLSESVEDAQAQLQNLTVNVQDLLNEIRVETIQPANTGGRSYIVNYTVTLPRFLKNNVTNLNGIVTLDSIDNDVTVLNMNGSATLTNITGSASANILNGQIQGAVTLPLNGVIDMTTLNGNIELEIPVNTSAVLSASVTLGTVTTQNLVLQNMVSTPTFLSGTLGNGQGTIILEAKQIGNITVTGVLGEIFTEKGSVTDCVKGSVTLLSHLRVIAACI